MKKILRCGLFLSILLTFNYSQTLDKKNLQKIIESSGLDKNQVNSIIKEQIVQPEVIFDKNINNISNEKILEDVKTSIDVEKSISSSENIDSELLNKKEEEIESIDKPKNIFITESEIIEESKIIDQYFGYNVFSGDPELFQKSMGESVDPDYLIGPGDEIVLMLWGETEFHSSYIVTRDGYLFIKNIGQVFVNGLTLEKLEKKLFFLLKKSYASLDPKTGMATTFFDVSLGALVHKPLRIFVLGDVKQPGAYSMKKSTTLFTALYYFDGPTVDGSLRKISLIRGSKEIINIDFYDYLLSGKKINDVRLLRDDVIFITRRGKTVQVNGEINRPLFYELKENEGLKKVISMAGGLAVTAYSKRCQIDRIIPPELRLKEGKDRMIIDVDLKQVLKSSNNDEYKLYDGDIIEFFRISDARSNIVTINGPVRRPGKYEFEDNLTLKDLIEKADGLLGYAYMDRVDIVRTSSDNTQSHFDVNLSAVLNEDPSQNIKLAPSDVVEIHNYLSMLNNNNLMIEGHVKSPGAHPYRKGMQVNDLIFLGGGFHDEQHLKNTYLDKAELIRLNENSFSYKIINFRLDSVLAGKGIAEMGLKMGDKIKIYSISDIRGLPDGMVTISGEVKRPGEYPLYDNLSMKELLLIAGGFEDEIFSKSIFFDRADLIRENLDRKTKSIIPINLNTVFDTTSNVDYKLIDGDQIKIYSKELFHYDKYVTINGSVVSPGEYEYKEDMFLRDLIMECGGLEKNIFFYRVDISRIDPKNKNENVFSEIITLYLKYDGSDFKVLEKDNNKMIHDNIIRKKLMPFDLVTIRPSPNFSIQRSVYIEGSIVYPGDYVLKSPNEMVTDIIARAGGLTLDAYEEASTIKRGDKEVKLSFKKIINNPKSKYNFSLLAGDSIMIGSRPNLVEIVGAINSPGVYQFIKGDSYKDYVKRAGGYATDASREGTFIIYPNGNSKKIGKFGFSPSILDGSTIQVAKKEEVVPFNLTEYVSDMTAIWADFSQAWLMVILALRSN